MKGRSWTSSNHRGDLDLELALIVALLCMACIYALGFLGINIGDKLTEAASIQTDSYVGGPSVPNLSPIEDPPGSGRYPIGPITGGTPPYQVIEITDPANPVVIGTTPDIFTITDPTVGEHDFQVVDDGDNRLENPIVITVVEPPAVPDLNPVEDPPGSGLYPIGPITGGTPPYQIIEITDPANPVIIGETPDIFIITDPTPGDHSYTAIDDHGTRLVQPITITIAIAETTYFTSDGVGTITGYDNVRATADGHSMANETIPASINGVSTKAIAMGVAISLPGFSKLTGSLTFADGITSIGAGAFQGCSGLTGVSLPTNLTSIENQVFYNCWGLTGTLTIPSGTTNIGVSAFSGCSGLTAVSFPESLTSIGNYAFNRPQFHALLSYVWLGGYPRWKDDVRPAYVVQMAAAAEASLHPLFAGIAAFS